MQIDLIRLAGGTKARAKDVNDNNDILKSAIYSLEEQLTTFNAYIEDLKRKPTRAAFEIYYYYSTIAPTGAFPLWTGEWITHCKSLYPDFWNELIKRKEAGHVRALDPESYEKEVKDLGQCGAFVVDELNGHVRLPKITRFISSLSETIDIGTTQDAALQKHKHNFMAASGGTTGGVGTQTYVASSTFAAGSQRTIWANYGNVTNTVSITDSGSDEKGHPQNVRMGLYIQVANNVAEISALDTHVVEKQIADGVEAIHLEKQTAVRVITETADTKAQDINTLGESVLTRVQEAEDGALTLIENDTHEGVQDLSNTRQSALGEIDAALEKALKALDETDVMTRVEGVAQTAIQKAAEAADSADKAQSAQAKAKEQADIAQAKAREAITAAAEAKSSETTALTAATTATQKASLADEAARKAADSQTAAAQSATMATQKASDASGSATKAQASETACQVSVQTATQKAADATRAEEEATAAATSANQKAEEAALAATAAAASESNAVIYKDAAGMHANRAAVSETNTKTHETNAASSADTATQAATTATNALAAVEAARDLARLYANADEDVIVETI